MSDVEDADLELLRQAALSSLIKKKPSNLQANALFYRPAANSNLISIQPVQNDILREDDGHSDGESSSGSEYAVIEEGLSVSSGNVDEVIEEVIVSEEDDSSEEEGGEDAISIASHDSFDEILNSVEAELKGGKKRTASSSHPTDDPVKPKRSRRDSASHGKPTRDRDRDQNRSRNDRNPPRSSGHQQRRSSPPRQKPVQDRVRNRSRSVQKQRRRSHENISRRSPINAPRRTNPRARSRSPVNFRRTQKPSPPQENKRIKSVSPPPRKRDRSRSPTENRKPRSRSRSPIISVNIRKRISPPASQQSRRKSNTGKAYVRPNWMKDDGDKGFESNSKSSSQRKPERARSRSKSREDRDRDRQQTNRRGLNPSNKEHKSRSPERRNQTKASDSDRKSPSPRSKRLLNLGDRDRRSKSKSPHRKILSFGDTHLRAQEKRSDKTRRSVTTSGGGGNRSRHKSRSRSSSPKNGKPPHRPTSKSPEVKSRVVVDKPRTRSKSPSPRLQNLTEEERERLEKRRLKFGSSVGKVSGKVVLKNSNSPSCDNSSKSKEEKRRSRSPAEPVEPEASPKKSRLGSRLGKVIRDDEEAPGHNRRAYHDDRVSAEKSSRSPQTQREDPVPKDIDKEDLRTKLQQRRAAGRIFSVAMRETLHKESSPSGSGNRRGRDRYAGNRNKKSSSRK